MFRVEPIAKIMPIKRFKKIREAIHANDNSKAPKHGDVNFDKLYKVRPVVDKLNKEFMCQSICSSSQSIDEAMILFKGRSSIKQYMPLKPMKRGYKVWMRADSCTGYAYQFSIYTGKSDDGQTSVGLGGKVVLSLCEALRQSTTAIMFEERRIQVQVSRSHHVCAVDGYETCARHLIQVMCPVSRESSRM